MLELGLTVSREKARALIMAGKVSVDGRQADKAGMSVSEHTEISVMDDPIPFVSRGG